VVTGVLGLVGLLVSAYLVSTHYFADQVPLACATGGIVDCEEVTTSTASMLGPVPVAVLGLLWFVAFLGLLVARRRQPGWRLMVAQVGWTIAGLVFVFYFVYAELFLIGAICLWCTAVHAVVVVLFLISVYEATAPSVTESLGA
jgi:uncharacterized membrane protein